ncbi:Sec-independent protein secretion pathway component TatC [Desulfocapsa sulfexigens DSM 10523]|uniref:Sec-independent protein translocase protein TatC n=1 Tax=Desulfocapsa sulfexigens (strain DSM 10523 / SB164P1) TaxID=1167006 RepID=M1NFI0_DESSD|nr:twin-arginine translocase subunit TatC [Desulfocapsa sulfexigens]AGF78414.1 Sec-independent protein secretion pathway component TatC [Desulfocapsa sulfexigens DSM 10523]
MVSPPSENRREVLETLDRHNTLVIFLTELRKSVRGLGISVIIATVGIFFLSPELLKFVQNHLADKLYFFSVAGPFLAHVKLAMFAALYVIMPWIMAVLWRAMGKPFGVEGGQLFFFVLFTCMLFYAGTLFCYFITLPFGISFLLGFGSADLQPVISIGRFVNFTTIFILAFGVIFELPMFMVFLAKVGVLTRGFYERNRRYALLLIAILAALLTPTPDVVNMLLMGGPLYFLYEGGIIILRIMRIQ